MDKKQLVAGIVVLLALVGGGTYWIAQEDIPYLHQCEDMVTLCFKLSAVNADGISTRCYYNSSSPTRYKNCKTGWFKVEYANITGNEIDLLDREVFILDTEWTNRKDAEDYLEEITKDLTYTIERIEITQQPYSDNIDVSFLIHVYKGEDRIVRLGDSLTFLESVTKAEIENEIDKRAEEMVAEWRPQILIDRSDLYV